MTRPPYARISHFVIATLICGLGGCEGDGSEAADGGEHTDSTRGADAGTGDIGVTEGPPLTQNAVSGDLTYAGLTPDQGGHLFSIQTNGALKQRLTRQPGAWGAHAVGPDPRFIVATRHPDADADGQPDPGSKGEAWIIDVKGAEEYVISPPECDVDRGGIGWRDAGQIVLAMACDGAPSAAFLGAFDGRERRLDQFLQVSDHEMAVRDVFPAVATPYYTYTVDTVNEAGVVKPTIWLAELNTTRRCQITDGDRDFVTVAPDGRVGDRWPAFNRNLTRIGFSRNTREPDTGPRGHLDAFSVGINFSFREGGCASDAPVNMSDTLRSERYPTAAGELPGDELNPQLSAGRAEATQLLYGGEASGEADLAAVYLADQTGRRTRLSADGEGGHHPRWIVTAFDLSGAR